MTIAEILEQARTLSRQERKELAILLIDTLDAGEPVTQGKTGAEIVALLKEIGPIDLLYPEIEDPVEWVKQIRRDQEKERGLDWGNDE